MASIDNGFGEQMPDKVNIELRFDINGRLMWVKTPSAQLPAKAGVLAGIATTFVETFQDKRGTREVYQKGTSYNTLAPQERSFLYMDVGRWGGQRGESGLASSEHREFGVVCGIHAVLCRFHNRPGKKPSQGGSGPPAQNIYKFLTSLCGTQYGVEVIKWESVFSTAKQIRGAEPVYVFLGDIHLPVVTKSKVPEFDSRASGAGTVYIPKKSEPIMGRVKNGLYIPVGMFDLKEWYDNYLRGDIFRGGANDLLKFLTQLELATKTTKVHFVQVGDLYDLWIGFDRFYKSVSGPPGKVVLKDPDESKKFIAYWLNRTNACHPALTKKLNELKVQQKTFLYGNHDNYLERYAPGLANRVRSFRRNGLYFEHGHWVDSSNYDGNSGLTGGHRITDFVFADPSLRSVDPRDAISTQLQQLSSFTRKMTSPYSLWDILICHILPR